MEELVRRGHDVTLFASGDSQVSAQLHPTVNIALWRHQPAYTDLTPFHQLVLGKPQHEIHRFDVI